MIFWHLSGPFDLAENNQAVHIWLMHGSFFTAGVLFWLQFIPSPPFRRRMPLLSQAAALLITNVIMIGIAMALSIFATHSVYPVYDHIPGVTLPAYADQQIGAAILWVCGDFWALPTMIVIVRRLIMADGNLTAALDRVLNRGASRSVPRGWGRPAVGAAVRGPAVPGPGVRGPGVRGPGVHGPGVRGPGQRPSPPDGDS
jgi:cytochrome c oxidase assembly factor CtaG